MGRLTGVYPSPSLSTYMGLYCCVACRELCVCVCVLRLSSRQEIKCFRLHVVKCLYKVYMQAGRFQRHAEKCPLSLFAANKASGFLCLYKPTDCFWRVCIPVRTGSVFTGVKRQRGKRKRERERGRCSLQCLMITGH